MTSVTPTVGADYLKAGLLAGAIGLALVVALPARRTTGPWAWWRSPASLVAAFVSYCLFVVFGRQLGFTLTLAGVAGAIVAIGITADSFIVYFERIRDEVREGRTLRVAADAGWLRARRTLLAADFVSFLARGGALPAERRQASAASRSRWVSPPSWTWSSPSSSPARRGHPGQHPLVPGRQQVDRGGPGSGWASTHRTAPRPPRCGREAIAMSRLSDLGPSSTRRGLLRLRRQAPALVRHLRRHPRRGAPVAGRSAA